MDPDSRHAHKTTERRQDGFKTHLVVERDPGLTTAARLTKANGPENSDANVGIDLIQADTTIADEHDKHLEVPADSAYAIGDMQQGTEREAL